MFLKKSEHKRFHPYFTLTVGTLAIIGAASIVKCAKNVMRCGCDKVTCMVKDVMGKNKNETTEG